MITIYFIVPLGKCAEEYVVEVALYYNLFR